MMRAALSLLLWLPCAAKPASVDAGTLRPLAVDLRPFYHRHHGTRYRPIMGFLAAPARPAASAPKAPQPPQSPQTAQLSPLSPRSPLAPRAKRRR